MAKSPKSEPNSPLDPEKVFQTMTDAQAAGLGSFSWLGTKWVESMSNLGSEWLRFLAERVQEDTKTQHDLLHAKDISEIQHIQTKFLQKAMDDYQSETHKLVQFYADTMSDIQAKAAAQKDQSKT